MTTLDGTGGGLMPCPSGGSGIVQVLPTTWQGVWGSRSRRDCCPRPPEQRRAVRYGHQWSVGATRTTDTLAMRASSESISQTGVKCRLILLVLQQHQDDDELSSWTSSLWSPCRTRMVRLRGELRRVTATSARGTSSSGRTATSAHWTLPMLAATRNGYIEHGDRQSKQVLRQKRTFVRHHSCYHTW